MSATVRLKRKVASSNPVLADIPARGPATHVTSLRKVTILGGRGSSATNSLLAHDMVVFLAVVAGAGVETTGRLFGWMGTVLAEHPDQRKELAEDHSLIPTAIEELLRFEPPARTSRATSRPRT